VRKDFKRGDRVTDRTLGNVVIAFRKTLRPYVLTKRFTFKLWSDWVNRKLGSVGKVWNYRFRGRV
jgi:hypothetical protein